MLLLNTNQYVIGETYIKLDFEFTEHNKNRILDAYSSFINENTEINLRYFDSLVITIEFDKGSLKTRIKIWGTIVGIYMGIANYGSFRSGVREIIKDVKTISEVTVTQIQSTPQINNHQVINFQRRLGIPGRLNDVYKRIDDLQRNINNYSPNDLNNILSSIKQEISDVSEILDNQSKQEFLNDLPENYRRNLPAPNPATVNFLYNKYALKPDDSVDVTKQR